MIRPPKKCGFSVIKRSEPNGVGSKMRVKIKNWWKLARGVKGENT